MPYQKRIPPIKVELTIEKFNYLIEILTRYSNDENESIKTLSTKLKEKLLRYSIPREMEENEAFVDIRFYPNEASDIIYMLIVNAEEIPVETNYYEVLLNVRKNKKEEHQSNQ